MMQHLAMSAIQNQKLLWPKKCQCDAEAGKSKTKTSGHVKTAKSRTDNHAEST